MRGSYSTNTNEIDVRSLLTSAVVDINGAKIRLEIECEACRGQWG